MSEFDQRWFKTALLGSWMVADHLFGPPCQSGRIAKTLKELLEKRMPDKEPGGDAPYGYSSRKRRIFVSVAELKRLLEGGKANEKNSDQNKTGVEVFTQLSFLNYSGFKGRLNRFRGSGVFELWKHYRLEEALRIAREEGHVPIPLERKIRDQLGNRNGINALELRFPGIILVGHRRATREREGLVSFGFRSVEPTLQRGQEPETVWEYLEVPEPVIEVFPKIMRRSWLRTSEESRRVPGIFRELALHPERFERFCEEVVQHLLEIRCSEARQDATEAGDFDVRSLAAAPKQTREERILPIEAGIGSADWVCLGARIARIWARDTPEAFFSGAFTVLHLPFLEDSDPEREISHLVNELERRLPWHLRARRRSRSKTRRYTIITTNLRESIVRDALLRIRPSQALFCADRILILDRESILDHLSHLRGLWRKWSGPDELDSVLIPVEDLEPRHCPPLTHELLDARYGAVGFDEGLFERERKLLDDWCANDFSSGVRLITGAGGAGKTRFVRNFVKEMAVDMGWRGGMLKSIPTDAELDLVRNWREERLVVIDEAHLRVDDVRRLLERVSTLPAKHPTPIRVVLVARKTGDWWARLKDSCSVQARTLLGSLHSSSELKLLGSDKPRHDPVHLALSSLDPTKGGRQRLYQQATADFAKMNRSTVCESDGIPDLEGELFDRPLYVVMAALLAVCGDTEALAQRIVAAVVDRERTLWNQAIDELELSRRESALLTSAVPQVVAAVALVGGCSNEDEADLLVQCVTANNNKTAVGLRDAIVWILKELFARDGMGNGGIEPLSPGLLADHLIAAEASEELIAAIIDDFKPHASSPVLKTCNRVAAMSPGIRPILAGILDTRLDILAEESVDAAEEVGAPLSEVITDAVANRGDAGLAEVVALRCPLGATNLGDLAIAAIEIVINDRRRRIISPSEEELSETAVWLSRLGSWLYELHRLKDAYEVAGNSCALFRTVGPGISEGGRGDFGGSLSLLAICQISLGLQEEAIATVREAVGVFLDLETRMPGECRSDLAPLLINLAILLGESKQCKEALAVAEQAVAAYETLADEWPERFRRGLALSLGIQARYLRDLEQHDEALTAAQRSIGIYDPLATERPESYLYELIAPLAVLSSVHDHLGQNEQALITEQRSTEILGELARTNPDEFKHEFASSLGALSLRLEKAGRCKEALGPAQQAVGILRESATQQPDGIPAELFASLINLARLSQRLGYEDKALAFARQAVEIGRRCFEQSPEEYGAAFACSLTQFAIQLSETDQREEALSTIEQAVEIGREVIIDHSEDFRPNLAIALNHLSICRSELDQREEALEAAEQAVDLGSEVAVENTVSSLPSLAKSLYNLANCLSALNRLEEALAIAERANEIYRELVAERPDTFRSLLALSLNNSAFYLGELGNLDGAIKTVQEAVEALSPVFMVAPDRFRFQMNTTVRNYQTYVSRLDKEPNSELLAPILATLERHPSRTKP